MTLCLPRCRDNTEAPVLGQTPCSQGVRSVDASVQGLMCSAYDVRATGGPLKRDRIGRRSICFRRGGIGGRASSSTKGLTREGMKADLECQGERKASSGWPDLKPFDCEIGDGKLLLRGSILVRMVTPEMTGLCPPRDEDGVRSSQHFEPDFRELQAGTGVNSHHFWNSVASPPPGSQAQRLGGQHSGRG